MVWTKRAGSAKRVLPVVLAVVLACFGYLFWTRYQEAHDPHVRASGSVEVTELQIAPQVGGRIVYLKAEEGDSIQSGDLVARLSLDGLDAQIKGEEAALFQARERLRELLTGTRPEEIAQAAADLRAQLAKMEQADRDAARFAALRAEGVVSVREAEVYEENARVARNAATASRERLALLRAGPREEEISQQRQVVEQARSRLEYSRTQLAYKEIFAPGSGRVLSKNYELGEVIAQGAPLATVGVMDDCWVRLYIPATQMGGIKTGQRATVLVDAPALASGKKSYPGYVKSFSQRAEFNPRLSLTQRERANQVFWVKVEIPNDGGTFKPGMPVDVVFE